ncbi:ATP-binding protein, partial [Candidatus Thiosymbion oneisti]
MEKVSVPAQAGRLINAVASIGYDPEVALCDLMDNSIDADARMIRVVLVEDIHEEGQADTVGRYIIADDGSGMEKEQLVNAFTLGSDREYPGGSLGKFGLGLKSAGLALGSRITLISKTASSEICCAVLSISDVVESDDYRIALGSPPGDLKSTWEDNAPNSGHGTVLVIDEATESRPAFAQFKR